MAKISTITTVAGIGVVAAAVFIAFVPTWTHPAQNETQIGPSPTSMIQFNVGGRKEPVPQDPPPVIPASAPDTRPATAVYKNVKVLTDVNAGEFMRLQYAITQWVSPKEGCGFCHVGNDFESDANPHKDAARLMLGMVRHINADWASHVQPAGVTCYTCHRGEPVPAETWFPSSPAPVRQFVAKQENWREDGDTVRKFFTDDSWQLYFLQDEPISVQSVTALPSHTVAGPLVAKRVYEMMMQMSDGMGVNCGYCHNSRVLESWQQSSPQRWNGYTGLRLTVDLNQHFLLQLASLIPQQRELIDKTRLPVLPARMRGPQLGNGLVVCATCHYARPQPLGGADMLSSYKGLTAPASQTPPANQGAQSGADSQHSEADMLQPEMRESAR